MEKVYQLFQPETKTVNTNENAIIVHLKISNDEIDNIVTMFSNKSQQTFNSLFNENNVLNKKASNKEEPSSISNYFTEPSPYDSTITQENYANSFSSTITDQVPTSGSLQSNQIDLLLLENFTQPNKNIILKSSNFQLMEQFDNITSWPQSTNIHCWWCRHPFNSVPCCIPKDKTKDGKYAVYGCFCSFNCTLAYIYDENKDVWAKINYLKELCILIKNEELNIEIAAPSWKLITEYGGILSIENFRNSFLTINNSHVVDIPYKYNKSSLFVQSSSNKFSTENEKSNFMIKRKEAKKGSSIEENIGLI